jgi:hypothetical protein
VPPVRSGRTERRPYAIKRTPMAIVLNTTAKKAFTTHLLMSLQTKSVPG